MRPFKPVLSRSTAWQIDPLQRFFKFLCSCSSSSGPSFQYFASQLLDRTVRRIMLRPPPRWQQSLHSRWGVKPWLATDYYYYNYCTKNDWQLKLWVLNHLESCQAAWDPIVTAGGFGTPGGSWLFAIGDQVRSIADACGHPSATSSSFGWHSRTFTDLLLMSTFSLRYYWWDACYSWAASGDVFVCREGLCRCVCASTCKPCSCMYVYQEVW